MSENEKPATPPPSKQDMMRTVGLALIERRKIRGLTPEKVSLILKIRTPYIKAMEQGDWGELPGEVYARGFVKRYAVYLGMDAEKLMAPYLKDRPVNEADNVNVPSSPSGSDASKGVLIAVSVAAIFLIVLIKLAKNEKAPATAAPETVVTATATAVAAAPAAPVAATDLSTPSDSHRLEVFSPYPLWVRVSADDKNFEGFIPQGATWTWSAKGKFSVRFGHSRKVNVVFDGVAVPLDDNQKKLELPE